MKKKYKEFMQKFEELCEEYAYEDFDAEELQELINNCIDSYSEPQ